jgi:hypothetical protein
MRMAMLRRVTSSVLGAALIGKCPLSELDSGSEQARSRSSLRSSSVLRPSGRLRTAAIVLWNTVYLGRALDVVRHRGDVVPDELLAHLAPLGWQHINLTGDYLWGADDRLAQDGFRPLRGISAHLPTAKAIAV